MKLHSRIDGPAGAPLLVLGPSLGTSLDLWEPQFPALTAAHRVLRYDLPGHGGSPAAEGFGIGDLADAVVALADEALGGTGTFAVGGVSLGGAVATAVAARHPGRVTHLLLCCTSAKFGDPANWRERAALVRARGTAALADTVPARWFTPAYDPAPFARGLAAVDDGSYAACCDLLGGLDLTGELAAITAPALVVAGAEDKATPLDQAVALAGGIAGAVLQVVPHAAHLANVERADAVTAALAAHLTGRGSAAPGERARRAVLGDAHVDRAQAATSAFTADFQDFITRYAWDGIWNRPGLDRRTRSCVTLTALVAGGHLEELAMHVRGALRNGLTPAEIKEVLLQTAVYCGVPAANSAFRIADRVLAEGGAG
ncbi:bifunctional 3-oxoadipate enol-lactonase/4-carboxymuconolactone decarboxylase PcaDC [Actinomadura parmotrematis]|uniref:4-carboxymuconolactone decarboxylase n=1 Tax=Actinomadura parmotrematis TaxID=2864039 RepID=A0ABS7FPV2_9ACTN|nr:4-carboxymuconolactone decarboxylase [Actinomadura parmotrematis]MBW8482407.1 4-carboxymuconolactone decarboxylase [Actinomadura parmotrematis]